MAAAIQRAVNIVRQLPQESTAVSGCRHLLEISLCCPSTRSTGGQSRASSSAAGFDAITGEPLSQHAHVPGQLAMDRLPAKVQSSAGLMHSHVGQYYPIDESKVPEAFQPWYANRDTRTSKTVPIEGGGAIKPLPSFVAGCSGLQYELAQSQYPYLMYRPSWAAVWSMVLAAQHESERRLLVKGAAGCGKSVFLAATAEMLRQRGWIVMYIPSCTDITDHTMSYSQSKETGMWDTREPAQSILRSMLEAHGDKLKELQQKVEGGSGTLYDLCSLEDNATDAQFCNAVVRLKLELYRLPASTPSAVLIDNYNSLFWTTDMYAPEHLNTPRQPRRLDAQELTLGANLRALADVNIGHTAVMVAPCTSASVPKLPIAPIDADGEQLVEYSDITIPLLDLCELTTMLQWYRYVEAISPQQAISRTGVEAAMQLTQGSGQAVRRNLHFLLPYSKALDDLDVVGETYTGMSLYKSGGRQ